VLQVKQDEPVFPTGIFGEPVWKRLVIFHMGTGIHPGSQSFPQDPGEKENPFGETI